MRIAVVTAIYGGYDDLTEPPAQTVDAEWWCVTDGSAEIPSDSVWQPLLVPSDEAPMIAAKVPKLRPDLFVDADVTVWIDGSCRLKHERSLELLLAWSGRAPLAQFAHPERTCVYAEACASIGRHGLTYDELDAQCGEYAKVDGHPLGWGLWATGVIVRHQPLREFGDDWLAEIRRWTSQDQVSQPVVLRRHGLRPATIPGNLWDNDVVSWVPHKVAA